MEGQIGVLLIGVGPHAQKVYVPWIAKNANKYGLVLKAAVELKQQSEQTRLFLRLHNLEPRVLFIDPIGSTLNPVVQNELNALVLRHKIRAVIIATEPRTHKALASWALDNHLHILMDKPITTSSDAANDAHAAKSILSDYERLDKDYKIKKELKDLLFSINVQRRYHAGFNFVIDKLQEVAYKTNCPVSSVQSSHADGQWRMPDEILDIAYHGFTNGYGKVSHSGYHFFDIIGQFLRHGTPAHKKSDAFEVYATFTKPRDYLTLFTVENHEELLPGYNSRYGQDTLLQETKSYGEIDCYSIIRFMQGNTTMATIQLSLLHNSLSQRSWHKASDDLYKGNGRVKHEYHCIQQGPFQCIQIHSYQSKDKHQQNTKTDYNVGGNNHFDISIFRNNKLIGGKRFEKLSINELLDRDDSSELLTSVTKGEVLDEFFGYLRGKRCRVRSDLSDHWLGAALMSSVYLAGVQKHAVRKTIRA